MFGVRKLFIIFGRSWFHFKKVITLENVDQNLNFSFVNTCLVGPLSYSLKVKGLNLKLKTTSYIICFWWFDNQNEV